ncbi:MAG: hypothetical protein H7098_10795 [Oligoflexus sp.]|nr:hypothetical protein [Pseudopedobacter sp.]
MKHKKSHRVLELVENIKLIKAMKRNKSFEMLTYEEGMKYYRQLIKNQNQNSQLSQS